MHWEWAAYPWTEMKFFEESPESKKRKIATELKTVAGLSLQTDLFLGEIGPLMEFYPENPEEAKKWHL